MGIVLALLEWQIMKEEAPPQPAPCKQPTVRIGKMKCPLHDPTRNAVRVQKGPKSKVYIFPFRRICGTLGACSVCSLLVGNMREKRASHFILSWTPSRTLEQVQLQLATASAMAVVVPPQTAEGRCVAGYSGTQNRRNACPFGHKTRWTRPKVFRTRLVEAVLCRFSGHCARFRPAQGVTPPNPPWRRGCHGPLCLKPGFE